MNWEYFSKRRRVSLAKFIEGSTTLEAALEIFQKYDVTPPPHDQITKVLVSVVPEAVSVVNDVVPETAAAPKYVEKPHNEHKVARPKKNASHAKKNKND